MTSGTMFEQGEIVIVPFPFSNLSSIKQRPVLILSKNEYNNNSDDVITCGITSNLKDIPCSILIDNKNLEKGSLPKQSRIKIDKLFTIEKNIVKKKIGKLNNSTMNMVREEFNKLV